MSEFLSFVKKGVYIGPEDWDGDIVLVCLGDMDLSKLKTVSGNLVLNGSYIVDIPGLISVGGNLNLFGTIIKELPSLTEVKGFMFIEEDQFRRAPNLKRVGKVYAGSYRSLLAVYRCVIGSLTIHNIRLLDEEKSDGVLMELRNIPEHELVLHLGHKHLLIREVAKAYIQEFNS